MKINLEKEVVGSCYYLIFGNEKKNGYGYEESSFLIEEEEWMCFVYSAFQKFASLAKVKSSKMVWWSCYLKNEYFGIKFSVACIIHFCFMKIKILLYNFTWTVKLLQFLQKTMKINPRGIFPLSLAYFIILLALKYFLMFFDIGTLRTRCYFVFCWQMFPFRNSERLKFDTKISSSFGSI